MKILEIEKLTIKDKLTGEVFVIGQMQIIDIPLKEDSKNATD